jgi:hypothetical protein
MDTNGPRSFFFANSRAFYTHKKRYIQFGIRNPKTNAYRIRDSLGIVFAGHVLELWTDRGTSVAKPTASAWVCLKVGLRRRGGSLRNKPSQNHDAVLQMRHFRTGRTSRPPPSPLYSGYGAIVPNALPRPVLLGNAVVRSPPVQIQTKRERHSLPTTTYGALVGLLGRKA